MHRGLPALRRRLDFTERSKVRLDTNTTVDGPPLKLDLHESSHSRAPYVINDACLT
jgi:hypothetical protein